MYCSCCGNKLNKTDKYCPECGQKTNPKPSEVVLEEIDSTTENYRIASIILGSISLVGIVFIVFSPISLILAIIGLILGIKANKNTVGIVINGVGLFLSFIFVTIMAIILSLAIKIYRHGTIDFGNYLEEKIELFYPYETSEDNYGDNF